MVLLGAIKARVGRRWRWLTDGAGRVVLWEAVADDSHQYVVLRDVVDDRYLSWDVDALILERAERAPTFRAMLQVRGTPSSFRIMGTYEGSAECSLPLRLVRAGRALSDSFGARDGAFLEGDWQSEPEEDVYDAPGPGAAARADAGL